MYIISKVVKKQRQSSVMLSKKTLYFLLETDFRESEFFIDFFFGRPSPVLSSCSKMYYEMHVEGPLPGAGPLFFAF